MSQVGTSEDALAPRLLCFHKQQTSARTRFLSYGASVLAPFPLPESGTLAEPGKVRPHPALALKALAARIGVPTEQLRPLADFEVDVATPAGTVPVLLIEIATLDPPFAGAEAMGARFIAFTEARGLPRVDLELMRRAYEILIG